ncbi:alpha-ketoglutarate-dependent 2,4-dichlorophenoxyacetate dioxygenase [Phellopilus nigrolimitatus]|nr:alpha-ketoglutarate-dependent 2,4-dichlorophenoxyacetate dioxygenase [Phellopilus nigrolimitatus]
MTEPALEPIRIGSLICKPLHPLFGAEIEGVDFTKPVLDEQIEDIINAENRQAFGITVYRKTGLTDESHIAFSRQLGKLENAYQFNGHKVEKPEIYKAGNIDENGNIIPKTSRHWWFTKGNTLWHADSTYNQYRSKYSLLLAHVVPKEGGNTDYADERHAFRDLPEETKAKLRGLVVKHNLWHSRKLAAPEQYNMLSEQEVNEKRFAYHKLVQIAPDGGETLYIASHASEIVGMPREEGLRIITGLLEYCTQPKYTISVKWCQSGDLIFWDNRQVMHRATAYHDQTEVRDVRRTTVYDDGPERYGVPGAASSA